jgi:hypothetical protein
MLREKSKHIVFACTFALLLFFLFSWRSGSYGEICEYNNATHQKDCAPYEFAPFICIKVFNALNDYGPSITALATVAIALFTYTLWKSTTEQARVTNEALSLARDEFIATHRPKIIVRRFQITDKDLPEGKAPKILFIAQNIGDSAATITRVKSATVTYRIDELIPTDLSFPFHEEFNVTLKSGERELFPVNGAYPLRGVEPMAIRAEKIVLYCMGTIEYFDTGGTQRETGFCRRYRPSEDRWETVDSEYEYTY